nr:hypothetical protein [Thermoplasmata archaeon]NIS10545.1 hypothetical protein [Thermoplasmata archaeon]NIS18506.1 hypothetical protein [Thermoplasmata archaeon]NIT75490.1 hypothetical protein [Thermoplasmata archaeon]NIU47661.1 hypothetical protein [Thermoplasmata archaeon]
MLIGISVILYGGLMYHLTIMQGIDMVALLRRVQMGLIVNIWQRDVFGRVIVYAIAILVLLGLQGAVWGFGTGPVDYVNGHEGEWVARGETTVVTGYSGEGTMTEAFPDLDHLNLVAANLTLGWNDNDVEEPGPGVTPLSPRNQPDSFRLIVRLPDGTQYTGQGTSDPASRLGEIRLSVPQPQEGNITGWIIEVECTEAGDVVGVL